MPVRAGLGGSPMAVDRRGSASPPPTTAAAAAAAAPLSKRDKRRNNITDRLNDMIGTFSSEQHQHYRAQLQAIQVDMTLVLRASPYNNVPLDDDAEDIESEIEKVTGGNLPHISNDAARRDYQALAGKRYHDYVQDINRAMEQRDADLTALKNRYDGAVAELERNTSYKIQVAQREHVELASTIRTRLISTVTKKRDKLLREKEQLDIADSSALFLNPNQFTMNIPGSPGGAMNPRKTRYMRHRVLDQDEAQAAERGRKRKATTQLQPQQQQQQQQQTAAAADDDATDSPAPSFRPLQNDFNGAASPFRDAKEKTLYAQYEAPVFSIERLFTDKELAHATTVAQISTHHFFHQQQQQQQQQQAASAIPPPATAQPPPFPPPTNGHTPTSIVPLDSAAAADATPTLHTADAADTAANASPPPGSGPLQAPDMERTVSHHATRNATRTNPLAALSEAAAAMSSSAQNIFTPTLIPITRTDKGAPTPPGVDVGQIDSDIALMFREDDTPSLAPTTNLLVDNPDAPDVTMSHADASPQYPDSSLRTLRNRFLAQSVADQNGNAPFRLPILETGPAHIDFRLGIARLPGYGYADPASMRFHVPVASSTANVGAPAVPVVNENLSAALAGGEPMSRATSFAGSDIGAVAGVVAGGPTNGNGASGTLNTNTNGNDAITTNGSNAPAAQPETGAGVRRVRSRLI